MGRKADTTAGPIRWSSRKRRGAVLVTLALGGSLLLLSTLPADAASFTPGCSAAQLELDVAEANTNTEDDTITLDAGCTYTLSATLVVGADGGNSLSFVGNGAIISGGSTVRVFDIAAGADVSLNEIEVRDGAGGDGAGILNAGTVTITDSTLSANHASGADNGGAINNTGTMDLTNVTISGNSAFRGGGVISTGIFTLMNGTVTDNTQTGSGGGGLRNGGGGTLTVTNSIVAENDGENCLGPLGSEITDGGNNLEFGGSGVNPTCSFSNIGNPLLGPLAYNGGPTTTHALGHGSAAIDAGTNTGCPGTDQRGVTRPYDAPGPGGLLCDIGAFEVGAHVVNSVEDQVDSDTADSICDTGDNVGLDPECTLRAAIDQANANAGAEEIHFEIPGAGPHMIAPVTALPTISDPVTIDGYTEPEADPATSSTTASPQINLNGNYSVATGLDITAGTSTVRGLVFLRFCDALPPACTNGEAILLRSNGGNTIAGNYIGTNPGDAGDHENGSGVEIFDVPNNTIGGTAPADRNIISNNGTDGVRILGGERRWERGPGQLHRAGRRGRDPRNLPPRERQPWGQPSRRSKQRHRGSDSRSRQRHLRQHSTRDPHIRAVDDRHRGDGQHHRS